MKNNLFISNFKKTVIIIVGVFLMVIIMIKISDVMVSPKDAMYSFYKLPEDSVDVLFVGSSHVYCSVNPVVLWDDYGISAYDLSAGSQPVWYSYYYIKEALKTQSPKVIMLDVYTTNNINDDYYKEKAAMNLMTMKPSVNKWLALKTSESDNQLATFWGFPIYHSKFDEIDRYDFADNNTPASYLGYSYLDTVAEYNDMEDMKATKSIVAISPKAEKYLIKIMDLCKEKEIELVLINSPCPALGASDQEKYNYVTQLANENNIEFINGCILNEEIGMDYTKDAIQDGGHLNYSGSYKYTKYLEGYLKQNYSLVDHRQDKTYKIWDLESDRLQNRIAKDQIRSSADISEYMQKLLSYENMNEFVIGIQVDGCIQNIPENLKNVMADSGINFTHNGLYVFDGGKLVYETESADGYEYHLDMGSCTLEAKAYTDDTEEGKIVQELNIGFESRKRVEDGVNIVVYDRIQEQLYDNVGFNEESEWTIQ